MRVPRISPRWLWLVPALLLVFVPVSLNAQDEPAPAQPLTPLMPSGGTQTAPDDDSAERAEPEAAPKSPAALELTAIDGAYEIATTEFNTQRSAVSLIRRRDYRAAETDEEKQTVLTAYREALAALGPHPAVAYSTIFVALLAKAESGTSDAADIAFRLMRVAVNLPMSRDSDDSDDGETTDAEPSPLEIAAEEILARHLGHPKLIDVVRLMSRLPGTKGTAALETLAADSPIEAVQVRALQTMLRANIPYSGQTEEQKAKALAIIERIRKDFPDAYESVAGAAYQMTRLQIGMEVPDIEGTDWHGVAFKLSDYRGQVVVLNFWGFW